jgi:phosphate transport system substrate-binding protein
MSILTRFLAAVAMIALSAPALAESNIRVGGSTNITPPLSKMAPTYQGLHQGTIISITGSNSGQGIAALRSGALDVACSDVAVDDPTLDDTTVGVIGFVFVVGTGAGIKNLTRADVQGIYSAKFTNWKQLGGNDLPIVPFSRPIGAGTRFVFEMNVAKTLTPMVEQPDATAVVNAVASTPGGIGYISTNYLGNHQDLVVNYEGVAPTETNIANHTYKFSTDEHVYTLKNASPDVKAFVTYAAGQSALLKAGGILSSGVSVDKP